VDLLNDSTRESLGEINRDEIHAAAMERGSPPAASRAAWAARAVDGQGVRDNHIFDKN